MSTAGGRWPASGILFAVVLLLFTVHCSMLTVSAQTTAFTFQGKLTDASVNASGPYDFTFKLYDQLANGNQAGVNASCNGVTSGGADAVCGDVIVANGIFTVKLDFGEVAFTDGGLRFIQIEVRPGASSGTYTALAPRQQITSAPFAIKSANANSADSLQCNLCVTDTQIQSIDGSKVTGTVANATTAATANNALNLGGNPASNFVDTTSTQTNIGGDKSFAGTISGNVVRANTQFNFGTDRVLAAPSGNLFAGLSAGEITTGPNNTFVGTQAGRETTSGNQNTFIGRRAGDGNVVGSNNTLIGAATSMPVGELNFATAIGAGSSVGTSNTVVLGRSADSVQVPGNLNITGTLSGNGSGLINVPGALKWQTVFGNTQAQSNNGYLATNDAQVTITLPTSPNVGDIVRVSGPGIGGWKIAQNAGQSIVGTGISFAQPIWTPRDTIRQWSSVASSADGVKLFAADYNGQLYTSTDSGQIWFSRESSRAWRSVASSADGSKLVATVEGGQIYTSADSGFSWIARESNRNWVSVASSADGTKLVAAAGGERLYTSTDSGATWTARATNNSWVSVASSADGTRLIAANGVSSVFVSADSGITWQPKQIALSGVGGDWRSVASSADGTKLAITGGFRRIYTSVDSGETWTPTAHDNYWNSIASSSDGSRLVAVTDSAQIFTSFDSGVSWTSQESVREWMSVATSFDGTKLVAVARNAANTAGDLIYTATIPLPLATISGTSGFITGKQYSSIELQYIGNGKFLPISYSGAISGF